MDPLFLFYLFVSRSASHTPKTPLRDLSKIEGISLRVALLRKVHPADFLAKNAPFWRFLAILAIFGDFGQKWSKMDKMFFLFFYFHVVNCILFGNSSPRSRRKRWNPALLGHLEVKSWGHEDFQNVKFCGPWGSTNFFSRRLDFLDTLWHNWFENYLRDIILVRHMGGE